MTERDYKLLDQLLRIEDVRLSLFREADGNVFIASEHYM